MAVALKISKHLAVPSSASQDSRGCFLKVSKGITNLIAFGASSNATDPFARLDFLFPSPEAELSTAFISCKKQLLAAACLPGDGTTDPLLDFSLLWAPASEVTKAPKRIQQKPTKQQIEVHALHCSKLAQ